MSAPRHALYWAPAPEHPLWTAGCAWLGRDASAGPAAAPLTAPFPAAVQTPAHYGWHATLKAPMHLAEGVDEAGLLAAVQALARRHADFDMPALRLGWLAGFLALQPAEPLQADHPLRRLADDAVRALDPLRGAPSASDARRAAAEQDPQRRALMQRWGYPHVFEAWRFHMTLSHPLPDPQAAEARQLAEAAARALGPALARPLRAAAVCVYSQPDERAPFSLRARFALGA